mmetsp:Transcript_4925/g.12506  ORF Transcript_4925/g.12506 Transcript_4925/m.12506 type:complete len:211 (+) Transcript_4925:111-743(+)
MRFTASSVFLPRVSSAWHSPSSRRWLRCAASSAACINSRSSTRCLVASAAAALTSSRSLMQSSIFTVSPSTRASCRVARFKPPTDSSAISRVTCARRSLISRCTAAVHAAWLACALTTCLSSWRCARSSFFSPSTSSTTTSDSTRNASLSACTWLVRYSRLPRVSAASCCTTCLAADPLFCSPLTCFLSSTNSENWLSGFWHRASVAMVL